MKKSTRILLVILLIVAALFVDSAFAIDVVAPNGIKELPDINKNPQTAIAEIIKYALLLTSVLAVMAITWGGIGFILSTGDDEKMKKSRKTIIFAFVGLVVAGLAYSIVEIITRAQLN